MPISHRDPRDACGDFVDRLTEFRILVYRKIRGTTPLRQSAHQLLVGLEGSARSRFQLDGLVDLAIVNSLWQREWLNRVGHGSHAIWLPTAAVEKNDKVVHFF